MSTTLNQLLHFWPNIRFEPASATTGYTWGKRADSSHILAGLQPLGFTLPQLSISEDCIVAERWMTSDDRALGSRVMESGQPGRAFFEVLEENPVAWLGQAHVSAFGPYLNCVMKQLDTHPEPTRGSLSVQVHPKPGHATRPAKPEMWQGEGHIYLGWNHTVSESEIRQAYESGTLERLMNAIKLTSDKLVLVKGGMIHAIRFNTFTAEWSMAPGKDDIAKGNLKDATVSPYDRTDGKTPRPGKEDLEATLALLAEYDDGLLGSTESELLAQASVIEEENGNKVTSLFQTPEVWVNQYDLTTSYLFRTQDRGLPLFVKQGELDVVVAGQVIDHLQAGMEVFVPAEMTSLQLQPTTPTVLQSWFKPL